LPRSGAAQPFANPRGMGRTYSSLWRWLVKSMSTQSGSVAGLGKARVESLTDGIFGAVMTILGLSLTIPYITGQPIQPLPDRDSILVGCFASPLSSALFA